LHTVPSTAPLHRVAPGAGTSQVPNVALGALVQMPPQQSAPRTHASPVWMQYEAPSAQWPSVPHRLEQHWLPLVHALPAVLQVLLSGVQVPLHCPLQHCELFAHAVPSEVHAVESQILLAPQLSEQQSVGALHGTPAPAHLPTTDAQVCEVASQMPEQHVVPL
jgi:hypothetical protein